MGVTRILDYNDKDETSDNYVLNLPCERLPEGTREKVLDYLISRPFESFVFCGMPSPDPWTGKSMWDYGVFYSDGEYSWNDKLFFYIRDHDLAVPDEFVSHVEKYYAEGGIVNPQFDWRTECLEGTNPYDDRKDHIFDLPQARDRR